MRPVHIVIPFKLDGAKSRLSSVLSPEERRKLALAMLRDVLDAVFGFGKVTLLTIHGFDRSDLDGDFNLMECSFGLNDALNTLIASWQEKGWPEDMLIVMADLALLTREDVRMVIQTAGDAVLSPGLGGGTNMILIRDPRFKTCYQGLSFPKHLDFVRKNGINAGIYASYRSGCDIDEPSDLAEILIHAKGESRLLLESMGFTLSEKGRAGIERKDGSNSNNSNRSICI
jgi:2-phospho-L-lactate guanylyltransferase